MASVTKSPSVQPPPAPSKAPRPAPPAPEEPLEQSRPHPGDAVAFFLWALCVLLMASMLVHDAVTGALGWR
jgi:hypothetical protein